jgi:hypothetical protein
MSFILVFGPDLEQLGELPLDVAERALGRDLEHEGGIAEQIAVAHRRHEGIGRALGDGQPDGPADIDVQIALDVVDQGPEGGSSWSWSYSP